MKESKDHLDIDLEFLDKKEPLRVAPKKPEPPKANEPNWRFYDSKNANSGKSYSGGKKYNWKNILIIGGVVLFFGWAIFSDSGSSTSTSTSAPTGNNMLSEGGQTFSCSDSNYDRAVQLRPSSATGAQLASESDSLDARISASKADKAEIDAMYVDENDQDAVDSYNERVDSYNSERAALIKESNDWDARHTAFDAQIDTYNNFLDANCSPQ
ncbi:MAG: hypothetical protein RLZZ347_14 [Candidatus Parcubacteria bacterium]|jgi:hypothetical protein